MIPSSGAKVLNACDSVLFGLVETRLYVLDVQRNCCEGVEVKASRRRCQMKERVWIGRRKERELPELQTALL